MSRGETPFKDSYRDMQEIVREILVLREHNLRFKEGDSQDTYLLFAEGALVIIAMERFLRIILGERATDRDTMWNLLEKAAADQILLLPWADQEEGRRRVCAVRNSILHANFEQAAREAGCSRQEYFKRQFAPEIETMFNILSYLMDQIDVRTGKPVAGGKDA